MTKSSIYHHPAPTRYRFMQWGALNLLIIILLAIPLQIFLAIRLPAFLFFITAILTLFMTSPIVMYLSVSPAIRIHEDGIEISPVIWRQRFIKWENVLAVKDYPLLPRPEQEIIRQRITGKRKYRAAEGIMLVIEIDDLPVQYRIAGFFAGERPHPIIALTNRTHTHYHQLVRTIKEHLKKKPPEVWRDSL